MVQKSLGSSPSRPTKPTRISSGFFYDPKFIIARRANSFISFVLLLVINDTKSSSLAKKNAVIIGGGPAGLTAAYELCKRTNIEPIVVEMTPYWGGISRTENQNGNRIDIGGHRFFSKSDIVMNWWQNIMPISSKDDKIEITYQNQRHIIDVDGPNEKQQDQTG